MTQEVNDTNKESKLHMVSSLAKYVPNIKRINFARNENLFSHLTKNRVLGVEILFVTLFANFSYFPRTSDDFPFDSICF